MIKCESKAKSSVQLSPGLHKNLKNNIKAKHKATSIVRVNGETLTRREAIATWSGYLAAQVSWQGPSSPAAVLEQSRSNSSQSQPYESEFDDADHTLDLLLYSEDLSLEASEFGDLAGSDHVPFFAIFLWGAADRASSTVWKPNNNVTRQIFDQDMREPCASLHAWIQPKIAAALTQEDLACLVDQ